MSITPTDPAAVARLAAHDAAQGDDYLGHVVWPAFTKTNIPYQDAAQAFADAGLAGFIPKASSKPDAFRIATKALEHTVKHDDGTRSQIRLRELADRPDEVIRRVVVEHVDAKGGRLFYGQTWELRFRKDAGVLSLSPVNVDDRGSVSPRDRWADPKVSDDYISTVHQEYVLATTTHNREALSRACGNVLDAASAVPVRPGGIVYYVPWEHRDKVASLKYLATRLEGVSINGVVIPNTDNERGMVLSGVTDKTMTDANEIIRDIRKAQDDGKPIGPRAAATMMTKYSGIKARLQEYRQVLGDHLEDATSQLEMLSKLMAQALNQVVDDEEPALAVAV